MTNAFDFEQAEGLNKYEMGRYKINQTDEENPGLASEARESRRDFRTKYNPKRSKGEIKSTGRHA